MKIFKKLSAYPKRAHPRHAFSLLLGLICTTGLMTGTAFSKELKLPSGMGGVPDIGAIPCEVFTNMLVIGPLGTRHSLLTWTEGYLYAKTERSMEEIVSAANAAGGKWDFETLTDHFVSFCDSNPDVPTREAAKALSDALAGP